MSSKDYDDKQLMHSKSNNIKKSATKQMKSLMSFSNHFLLNINLVQKNQ